MVSVTPTSNTQNQNLTTEQMALSKLSDDFNQFLKLLTVQLQHQDPTEPMDTNQLTDQITQLSQVEQAINSNKKLENIKAAIQGNAINNAVSYVDRFVEFESKEFYQRKGATSILSYKLPEDALDVKVAITDEKGKVLHTITGDPKGNTPHAIIWDGKDLAGNVMETGKYKINIIAKGKNGKDLIVPTSVTDIVTEVAIVNGEVELTLGDIKIPASQVKAVKGVYAEIDGLPQQTPAPVEDEEEDA